MTLKNSEILLTEPRGFCAGVERAIEIVNRAVEIFDETIFVKHEVVPVSYTHLTLPTT